jgi:hypothetical protein
MMALKVNEESSKVGWLAFDFVGWCSLVVVVVVFSKNQLLLSTE